MNRQQMQALTDKLSQDEEIEDARIVEFMGKPHIHVDLVDGDIEVIDKDGNMRVVPIHGSAKNS